MMNNRKTFDLTISNYGTAKDLQYDIVVLPWGATEPHNYHLPYLTDCILSHAIAVDSAVKAHELYGLRCMVMPPITLGSQNPGQRDLPFCVHGRYETQKAILTDIVASLNEQGINKMVIINGHGGNNFKNMIRDLAVDYPNFLIATSEWFTVCPAKDYFEEIGDHADEVETSVMMHYHPELVNLEEAKEGRYTPFVAPTLQQKVAWIPRNWQRVSTDTGIGNPAKATAKKGEMFANAVSTKYAELLNDLVHGELYVR